jgi:hypothetical protein
MTNVRIRYSGGHTVNATLLDIDPPIGIEGPQGDEGPRGPKGFSGSQGP